MLKKIASNTLAQVFSKVITAIITIFLLGLITNYFTIELYWSYNMIFNYIFIFAFLVDLWLYAMTIKEISQNKNNSEYIFWNILTLRLISAICVIFFSVWIAYFLPWYNSNLIISWIFIASLFTFFSLINSNLLALMQAYMKIEFSIISVIVNKLFVLSSVYYVIKYKFPNPETTWYYQPFLYIIWAVALWMYINMVLNYFYAKKLIKIKFRFDFNYIKKIFLKSLPYGIALFLSVVYTKIDIILLSLIEKGIIAETSIALYSLPLKIMDVFMIIWWFFMNSLLPSIWENYKNKNFKKINQIITNWLKVMYTTWIIVVSLWLVFKDYIIKIVANEQYLTISNYNKYTSSDAFSVVLFMILFFYLWIVFSYFLIATDNQKKLLKISIILTTVNIIWNIILIPYMSFIWAWITTIVTQIIFLFLVYIESNKIIKIKLPILFILWISIWWLAIYYIALFLTTNYSIGLYLDLIYWIILTVFFFSIVWIIEYKKFKLLK